MIRAGWDGWGEGRDDTLANTRRYHNISAGDVTALTFLNHTFSNHNHQTTSTMTNNNNNNTDQQFQSGNHNSGWLY
jgi:hypothetical protein